MPGAITGVVLVLIVACWHELVKGWLDDLKSARRLLPDTSEEVPALRREVIVKNPVKNK